MPVAEALFALTALLLVALVLQPLATRLRLPFGALLALVGFVGSELIVRFGGDTGLRWFHFRDLILHVLLPLLIFHAALNLDARLLRSVLATVLTLALPLMLVTAALIAVALYYAIGHGEGFPWLTALAAGALLSATDPAAALAVMPQTERFQRLTAILQAESLFNDASAIVLFTLLLAMAVGGETVTLVDGVARFGGMLAGGLLAGAGVGLLTYWLLGRFTDARSHTVLTVGACVLSYYGAEHVLHTSAVISELTCGLILGGRLKTLPGTDFVERFWSLLAWGADALLFLLMGVTITVGMFEHRWLAMLIGVAAVLAARGMVIHGLLRVLQPWIDPPALGHRQYDLLVWGGVRGAVTLALVLSLPTSVDGWWTVQAIAYGVVVFSLFAQAPSLPALVRRVDRDVA